MAFLLLLTAQVEDRIERGEGSAWIRRIALNPRNRVIDYRQTVFRKGPGDKEPVALFEEVDTEYTRLDLGEDGLLIVQVHSGRPRIYFPGSTAAIELGLPLPEGWGEKPAGLDLERFWVLGDAIFYLRSVWSDHSQVGIIRVDGAGERVKDIFSVAEMGGKPAEMRTVEPLGRPLRVADHILWLNRGAGGDDWVKGPWAERAVRAWDLKSDKLAASEKIDPERLRAETGRLFAFLESQAKEERFRRAPELELWAVKALAKAGTRKDAQRLSELADRIQARTREEEVLQKSCREAAEHLRKYGK